MKIAILGGTFDPVTKAHIQIAEEVLKMRTDINEVWLMPVYANPLKTNNFMFDRVKVLNTLKLQPRIKISTFEIDSKNENGTYANLKALEKRYPEHEFVLIIGMDCAAEIKKWKNYEKLLEEYSFILMARLSIDSNQTNDIFKLFFTKEPRTRNEYLYGIEMISSTDVRNCLKSNGTLARKYYAMTYFVPQETIGEIMEQTILRGKNGY